MTLGFIIEKCKSKHPAFDSEEALETLISLVLLQEGSPCFDDYIKIMYINNSSYTPPDWFPFQAAIFYANDSGRFQHRAH